MPLERPGSVTAAGVLCIIYGSLFTLCGLCGVAGLAMQGEGANPFAGGDPAQAELQKQLQANIEADVPAYRAFNISTTILSLGEAVCLLIGGIGLLRLQPWARTLTLVVSWVVIATTVVQAVYQLAFVIPAMNRVFQALAVGLPGAAAVPANAARALRTIMMITAFVMIVIYAIVLIYFVVIIILLSRSRARLAFEAAARGDLDQGDDEHYGDRGRRDYGPRDDDRYDDREEGPEDWRRPPPSDEPRDDRFYR